MKENETIGLALGGGAVLGAVHVGVLKVIEESNIKINYISGTSIGAFAAVFYAFGKNTNEIEDIVSELKWMNLSSISLSKFALLSNKKMGELIIKHIGDKNIEDSLIPLAIIATDATTGEKVILDKGSVANAVMASTCIPGIYSPIEKDNKMLIDGGIVENVPIHTTRKMGAEFVIGVDLNSNSSHEKPNNILDVIFNSFHFIMKQSVIFQTEKADLLFKPNLSTFNSTDTNQVKKLINKGYNDFKILLEKNEMS